MRQGIKAFFFVLNNAFREFVLHKPTKNYALIYMGSVIDQIISGDQDTNIQTGEIDISIFECSGDDITLQSIDRIANKEADKDRFIKAAKLERCERFGISNSW